MEFQKLVIKLLIHILNNCLQIKQEVTGSRYENSREGDAIREAYKWLDKNENHF